MPQEQQYSEQEVVDHLSAIFLESVKEMMESCSLSESQGKTIDQNNRNKPKVKKTNSKTEETAEETTEETAEETTEETAEETAEEVNRIGIFSVTFDGSKSYEDIFSGDAFEKHKSLVNQNNEKINFDKEQIFVKKGDPLVSFKKYIVSKIEQNVPTMRSKQSISSSGSYNLYEVFNDNINFKLNPQVNIGYVITLYYKDLDDCYVNIKSKIQNDKGFDIILKKKDSNNKQIGNFYVS